jgi:hypothetical protein
MKKLLTVLLVILMTSSVFLPRQGIAQTPEKMSFQAVIRNSSEALVTNKQIGIQISILQGSASGTAVYAETQTPTTNANGLVSLEIGAGTVVSGTFATIDWSAGPYFIKTETDLAGGTSYTITGTSQLLSVPYALHAKTAETITGSIIETDPIFTNSPAAKITETHLANLENPLYRRKPEPDSKNSGPVKVETDPIYSASQSANITTDDISNLRKLSGTNTGDQDGSETKVIAGANVTVTGLGTSIQPYVLNSIIDIGATGPQGIQGETGLAGPKGDQGDKGEVGLTGAKGEVGLTGDQGMIGLKGTDGETGPQGIQGTEGLAGPKGDQGDKGEIGLTGAKGEIGLTGDQGPIGLTGTDGATGPQGIQGTEGLAGPKGDQGIAGNDGPTGPQGPAGAAGLTTSVNSVIQVNGEITLTTTDIPEGDKKYYTDALVAANTAVAANTLKKGITDGTTSGDMQYWNGSEWVLIPSGTVGQVLTLGNTGPVWQTPSGSTNETITLTTTSVSNINASSAISGGDISDSETTVTIRGICWSTSSNPTRDDNFTSDGSGIGSFVSNLTGLEAATTYYIRAYAINLVGITYGDEKSFTTPALTSPVVETLMDISQITGSTAIGGGEVISDGFADISARGICWSTTSTPTILDNLTTDGIGVGSFSSSMSGLTAETSYFVRAYATNSIGTSYGEETTFTTSTATLPVLATLGDVAYVNPFEDWVGGGDITDDGGVPIIARGICWSFSPSPTLVDNNISNGAGSGVFESTIPDNYLLIGYTIYIRAYATNILGTSYGNEIEVYFIGVGL